LEECLAKELREGQVLTGEKLLHEDKKESIGGKETAQFFQRQEGFTWMGLFGGHPGGAISSDCRGDLEKRRAVYLQRSMNDLLTNPKG